MVHPDMRIGLYISNFLCVSTTIVIYSHLSESTPCKAPLYDIKIRSEKVCKRCFSLLEKYRFAKQLILRYHFIVKDIFAQQLLDGNQQILAFL